MYTQEAEGSLRKEVPLAFVSAVEKIDIYIYVDMYVYAYIHI